MFKIFIVFLLYWKDKILSLVLIIMSTYLKSEIYIVRSLIDLLTSGLVGINVKTLSKTSPVIGNIHWKLCHPCFFHVIYQRTRPLKQRVRLQGIFGCVRSTFCSIVKNLLGKNKDYFIQCKVYQIILFAFEFISLI